MDKLLRLKDERDVKGEIVEDAQANSDVQVEDDVAMESQVVSESDSIAEGDIVVEDNVVEGNIVPQRHQNYFANLGAPRQRDFGEYTPSAILEDAPKPVKIKTPHFKLIPSGTLFEETSNASLVKYGILALFIGISVTSFLTQGVLAIKDMVFGPSSAEMKLVEQNADLGFGKKGPQSVQDLRSNQVLADSRNMKGKTEGEALGSDDSAESTASSSSNYANYANLDQYRLSDEASFPRLTSTSYLAADLLTGEIIYEKNEGLVAPVASVTKLMTAVIAVENLDMQKIAVVSRDAYNTYGGQGELLVGEKIKLYDLMHPLLMESSNDGAEVLSEAHEGGREAFMSLMNKKAAEIGMHNTYFEDPSGLNPKNVSSVEDLLKLGRYIYQKHPQIFDMTHVRQYSILKHTWFNKNRFLTYDTFIGGKNGYIDEAKKTTVSIFDVVMAKGGKRPVVIVLLKSDDREGDAVKLINFLKKNAYYKEVTI